MGLLLTKIILVLFFGLVGVALYVGSKPESEE